MCITKYWQAEGVLKALIYSAITAKNITVKTETKYY